MATATTAAIRIIVTTSGRANDNPDRNDGQDIEAPLVKTARDLMPDARVSDARHRVICENLTNTEATGRGRSGRARGNLLNWISYRVFVPTHGTVARMNANNNRHDGLGRRLALLPPAG